MKITFKSGLSLTLNAFLFKKSVSIITSEAEVEVLLLLLLLLDKIAINEMITSNMITVTMKMIT